MLHKVKNGQILDGLPELKDLLPSSVRNKKMLLGMARRGESRPIHGTLLYKAMCRYINKESKSYDPEFAKEIRRTRPDWFMSTSEKTKILLLDMAKKGEPKPSPGTALYKLLYSYALESSRCYDPDFTRKIRRIAPYWFLTKSQPKKDMLLEIARRKGPKPKEGDPLCYAMRSYMNCDPNFAKEIRSLCPDWFVSSAQRNKELLLAMARRREPRPKQKSPMGGALSRYTAKTSPSYDPVFAREIRRLAPHWFKKKPL